MEEKTTILVCQSLEEEMRIVADEKGIPCSIRVFSSMCHRDPVWLARLIEEALKPLEGERVFIAYGECFRPAARAAAVRRLAALNCAAVLLGGVERYMRYCEGAYFFTPHLAVNWREYFLGGGNGPPAPRDRHGLSVWFKPIDRLVMIDTGTKTAQTGIASIMEFSEIVGKPVDVVRGTLDFLSKEYEAFCGG